MLDVLISEGYSNLLFSCVTRSGLGWDDHSKQYEEVRYPVLPDEAGVFALYGADTYDVYLIDKEGRLVTKKADFVDSDAAQLNQRIRELHAE